MNNSGNSLTHQFITKLWGMPFSDESVQNAKFGLLDYIASSFAGKEDSGVHKLICFAHLEGGHKSAPVLFHQLFVSRSQSALINGFMGHVLDYDDVHVEVRGHPSTVILPTLIAIAESNRSGRRFLEAYVIGVEAMARIAEGLTHQHYEQGFHNTSTAGVLAATIAGAYLKGWSVEKTSLALGFATTQASGLRVHFGTETKPLHAGLAASAAVRAIQFAEIELQANRLSLDNKIGFFDVYGQGEAIAREKLLTERAKLRIVEPGLWFKLYPFCSGAYFGLHASEQIKPIAVEQITAINIIFTHHSDAALIHRNPANGEEGRFSIEYIVALMLSGRGVHPDYFQKVSIDEEIRSYMQLMKRTNVHDIPAHLKYTKIELHLSSGETISAIGHNPKGSPSNRVTESELLQKYKEVVKSDEKASQILNLDKVDDINKFFAELAFM